MAANATTRTPVSDEIKREALKRKQSAEKLARQQYSKDVEAAKLRRESVIAAAYAEFTQAVGES